MKATRIGGRPSLLILAILAAGCTSIGAPGSDPNGQIDFGVRMARQGLWSEAMFRFEQARVALPNDPRVLNNLAVSFEAVGRFDDALATYKEAVRVSPGNRDLRVNYQKFLEFYQNFTAGKALDSEASGEAPKVEKKSPAPAGGGSR